jgi:hypothetical protein
MRDRDNRFDDVRAVTVTDSVATVALVGFTLVVAGGLGLGLTLSGGDSNATPSANFSFEYIGQSNLLFVTKETGDPIPAGELVLTSGDTEKTWAAVADSNNSSTVETGDTVPLGENSPFGKAITGQDQVIVRWESGNQTKRLGNWSAQSESGSSGFGN